MYRVDDRLAAIRELQKFLSELSVGVSVYETGIYDDATEKAVNSFKIKYGLAEEVGVSRIVYEKIYREYLKMMLKKDVVRRFGDNYFPIEVGDFGGKIFDAKARIAFILDRYGVDHGIRGGSYFNTDSRLAFEALAEILDLDPGEFDEIAYDRIEKENVSLLNFYK